MANAERITVDKAYFDALLRRGDFHTSMQFKGRHDPANVTISKSEYDSLKLRISHEYEQLKTNLFQGGVTAETLAILVSNTSTSSSFVRHDSGPSGASSTDDNTNELPSIHRTAFQLGRSHEPQHHHSKSSHTQIDRTGQSIERDTRHFRHDSSYDNDLSKIDDDCALEDEDDESTEDYRSSAYEKTGNRTLYICGFPEWTTLRDLLSVVKGGRVLSVNMRSERSATVTLLDGAAEFLAWAKRNDIYLHSKRVEVRWAERQYHLNKHIANKAASGATRNLLIYSAQDRGLTEPQIRADMEHIHNLIVIDVTFRSGNAYVSMNSVHNALFARTCMMSRTTYRGCKVEFFPDECDVPLPLRRSAAEFPMPRSVAKVNTINNRFGLLDIDGEDPGSDEENRAPIEDDSDAETMDGNAGVNLTTEV